MLQALRNHHPKSIFFDSRYLSNDAFWKQPKHASWAFCDMGWDASFSWMTFFCLATKQNLLLDKIFFNLRFPKKWLRRCQRSRIITGSLGTRFGCKRSYHWRRRVHRKRQREINFFAHKTFVHNFSQALPRNHPETSAVKKKKEILSDLKSNQQQNRFLHAVVMTLTHCVLFSQTNQCCLCVFEHSGLPEWCLSLCVPLLSQTVPIVFHLYRGHIILSRFQSAVVLWQDLYLPFLFLLLLSRCVFSRRFWGSSPRRQRYESKRDIRLHKRFSFLWVHESMLGEFACMMWCPSLLERYHPARMVRLSLSQQMHFIVTTTFMHCRCSKTMKLTFMLLLYHANKYCCFLS